MLILRWGVSVLIVMIGAILKKPILQQNRDMLFQIQHLRLFGLMQRVRNIENFQFMMRGI